MTVDPYGRAIRDFHRGDQADPLVARDGADSEEHPIEEFYFGEYPDDTDDTRVERLESWLQGPLLDAGAGVGKHALYFQGQFETTAIEVSSHLVETMRERGVDDARHVDMFELREAFEPDRFRSVLANGTQIGLSGSVQGLRRLLGDLAFVTTPDATAVLDSYDPSSEGTAALLGYRADPTPGLAHRVLTFEYEGDVSETLLFRLFSPGRLREATTGTGWEVEEIARNTGESSHHYQAALAKR